MIIGRPIAEPEAIEHLAAAITGMPVVAGPMIEQLAAVGPTPAFPQVQDLREPAAEMIRQAVTEAAVDQAVGG